MTEWNYIIISWLTSNLEIIKYALTIELQLIVTSVENLEKQNYGSRLSTIGVTYIV